MATAPARPPGKIPDVFTWCATVDVCPRNWGSNTPFGNVNVIIGRPLGRLGAAGAGRTNRCGSGERDPDRRSGGSVGERPRRRRCRSLRLRGAAAGSAMTAMLQVSCTGSSGTAGTGAASSAAQAASSDFPAAKRSKKSLVEPRPEPSGYHTVDSHQARASSRNSCSGTGTGSLGRCRERLRGGCSCEPKNASLAAHDAPRHGFR